MTTLADQNLITAMKFQPLNEIQGRQRTNEAEPGMAILGHQMGRAGGEVTSRCQSEETPAEFLAENPSKHWEGEIMLASMGAVKENWRSDSQRPLALRTTLQ